jgi:hypothetical protein
MSYSLVLTEPSRGTARNTSDNVLFSDLPADYKVYLFYYPGAMRDEAIDRCLRDFGDEGGDNYLVYIGKLSDPSYAQLVNRFELKSLPVVVVTATADLASIPEAEDSAFIRIDSKQILSSPEQLTDLLQKLVNFFLQGKIEEAAGLPGSSQRRLIASRIFDTFSRIVRYVSETDISIGLFGGKLELKRHTE